jgi:transcriptional regulator
MCHAEHVYVPAHFAGPDDALPALLASAPLVDLVTAGPDGLVSTPLPMLLEPAGGGLGALHGHVARNNSHWRLAAVGDGRGVDSLAIVRGPDAYISPRWYAATSEHGRVVPTWNYQVVHVSGRLVAHDDLDWTRDLVRRLTARFEDGQAQPWSMDDAPADYVAGQLRAIVGVELVITSIQSKYKLSQNRSAADVAGVVDALAAGTASDRAVSEATRFVRAASAD